MLRTVDNDQRFAQGGRETCVKCGVPLFVLLAKAHHDHISVLDTFAGTDRVDHGALVVMPVFLVLRPKNGHAAIVRGAMIGDGAVKADIKTVAGCDDLLAPIGVNFARQINIQCHGTAPQYGLNRAARRRLLW